MNVRVDHTISWKTTNNEGIVPKIRIWVESIARTTIKTDDLSVGTGGSLKRNMNDGKYKGKD